MTIKIKDMEYERMDIPTLCKKVANWTCGVENASSAEEVMSIRREYIEMIEELGTATNIAYIRFSQNTKDEFYLQEQDYYDENTPLLQAEVVKYQNALLSSPFRDSLEQLIGKNIFKLYECGAKSMSEEIVPERQEEARLSTEYSKFASGLSFSFGGEEMPLTILRKYMSHSDRGTRRQAFEVLGNEMAKHRETFDNLFDRLVKVRDRMAKKMGYKNYVEMGYYNMERVDFDRNMVEIFRRNVAEHIVPAVCKIKEKVSEDLGISSGDFKFFDNETYFQNAPEPVLSAEEMLQAGEKMYCDMSQETAQFIRKMMDAEALDVLSRENKWGGGYCTYIPRYKQPFILANFNSSSADVDVLTHEAGHAFNSYETAGRDPEEGCGMETAEIHSMSMEFFCWKYMDWFFGDRAEEYRYAHLCDSITFIPYGVIVDEFQHEVYENPNMTPAERNACYLALEKKYRPYISWEGIPYLEEGTRWQYQAHIFEMPFYYIDYCIAGSCALGFLAMDRKDHEEAFKKYHEFILVGGESSLAEKIKKAGLVSPFEEGGMEEIAKGGMKILQSLNIK